MRDEMRSRNEHLYIHPTALLPTSLSFTECLDVELIGRWPVIS